MRTHGKVGNGSEVFASFGANDVGGVLQLGKKTFVSDGNTIAGDLVNLLNDANVFDVLANQLHKGFNVTVRGTVGTPVLPLTNPFCPIPTLDCSGGIDQVIQTGANVVLTPGTYGAVAVRDGGTLVLSPAGTFNFCSLRTARNAAIVVNGTGLTTINVVGDFRLADASTFLPGGSAPTPLLNIGGTSLRIGRRATIQAFISAPNADAAFGAGSKIIGSFCVNSNRADKGITLECPMPATTGGS